MTAGARPDAATVVGAVVDPELPVLTLTDLGVVRAVTVTGTAVEVTVTPTYSACPAIDAIRADIAHALMAAGYGPVRIRTVRTPEWSTDWITPAGRSKLAAAGIAPPGPASGAAGPVPVALLAARPAVACPRCGSPATDELSRFGPTACTALRRCRACSEPFEHLRPI